MFGPARCMFGSHMPTAGLSVGFERLYDAYQEIVARFSRPSRTTCSGVRQPPDLSRVDDA